MIEKFNFYDVYGYFLPGVALLTLLWLPFGLTRGWWPKELSSALLAIPFAYLAGHILQTLAVNALPSEVRDPRGSGRLRHPSDVLLDDEDPTFSREFKDRLAGRIRTAFRIDVAALAMDGDAEARSRRRRDAFFQCRSALIKAKTASYAEQFEGLYALMRGLTAAFGLALCYHLGWSVAGFKAGAFRVPAVIVAAGGLILAVDAEILVQLSQKRRDKVKCAQLVARYLMLTLASCGYLLGTAVQKQVKGIGPSVPAVLALAVLVGLFTSIKFFGAYRFFANEFAKAIYRDFYNYEKAEDERR